MTGTGNQHREHSQALETTPSDAQRPEHPEGNSRWPKHLGSRFGWIRAGTSEPSKLDNSMQSSQPDWVQFHESLEITLGILESIPGLSENLRVVKKKSCDDSMDSTWTSSSLGTHIGFTRVPSGPSNWCWPGSMSNTNPVPGYRAHEKSTS